jgi:hypothetical protein
MAGITVRATAAAKVLIVIAVLLLSMTSRLALKRHRSTKMGAIRALQRHVPVFQAQDMSVQGGISLDKFSSSALP